MRARDHITDQHRHIVVQHPTQFNIPSPPFQLRETRAEEHHEVRSTQFFPGSLVVLLQAQNFQAVAMFAAELCFVPLLVQLPSSILTLAFAKDLKFLIAPSPFFWFLSMSFPF